MKDYSKLLYEEYMTDKEYRRKRYEETNNMLYSTMGILLLITLIACILKYFGYIS